MEELKEEAKVEDLDKKDPDEDENVTAEAFEHDNKVVEESKETEF